MFDFQGETQASPTISSTLAKRPNVPMLTDVRIYTYPGAWFLGQRGRLECVGKYEQRAQIRLKLGDKRIKYSPITINTPTAKLKNPNLFASSS